MKAAVIAVLAVCALAGIGWILFLSGDPEPVVPRDTGEAPAPLRSGQGSGTAPAAGMGPGPGVVTRPYSPGDDAVRAAPLANSGSKSPHDLTGIVRGPDGRPLDNAEVGLCMDLSMLRDVAQQGDRVGTVRTGSSGRFVFPDLPLNEHFLLIVTHDGFAEVRRHPITPMQKETMHQEIRMAAGGAVLGRVTTSDGRAVVGAKVLVHDLTAQTFDPDPPCERFSLTDKEGAYEVSRLSVGVKKVQVKADGLATDGMLGVAVQPGAAAVADFVLDVGATIEGLVVDKRTGAPIPGALVLARPQGTLAEEGVVMEPDDAPLSPSEDGVRGSDPLRERLAAKAAIQKSAVAEKFFLVESAVTDERGAFRLTGLLPARYLLQVSAKGYLQATAVMAAANTSGHRIEMSRNASVRGRVIDDATGAPITAFVVAQSASEAAVWLPPMSRQRFESADGSFTYLDAMPGRHWMIAEAPGYARSRSQESVQITPDVDSEGVVIRMQRGSTLKGRVVARGGTPLEAASVQVVPGAGLGLKENPLSLTIRERLRGGSDPSVLTNAEGTFEIPQLAAGTLRLRVTHADHIERYSDEFQVDGARDLEVGDIELEPGGRMRGLVRRKDGGPDAGAIVMLQPKEQGQVGSMSATADEEGRYEFKGLRPGVYQVIVAKREGELNVFAHILGAAAQPGDLVTIGANQVVEKDL